MKIRPGRMRSLIGGIAAVLVTIVGVVMLSSMGGFQGRIGLFMVAWVVIGLAGASVAFYNAFSKKGVPLYEIETLGDEDGDFCPQCGARVGADDRFCRACGAALKKDRR